MDSPSDVVDGLNDAPPGCSCLPLLLPEFFLYDTTPRLLVLLHDRLSKDSDEVRSMVNLEDGDDAALGLLEEGLVGGPGVCRKPGGQ